MGGLETTSNDLDTDFSRSSLRLSRFFGPNLGDLPPPKKKIFSETETQFLWSNTHQVLDQFSSPMTMGGLFSFLVQTSASKVKTWYFAYSSGQRGGGGRATLLRTSKKQYVKKFLPTNTLSKNTVVLMGYQNFLFQISHHTGSLHRKV